MSEPTTDPSAAQASAPGTSQGAPDPGNPPPASTSSAAPAESGGRPLSKAEQKAAINAKLRAAGASDSPAAQDAKAPAEPAKPAEPAPEVQRSVAVISRLSAENRALKEQIKAAEAKSADQTDSVAALRVRVKADPGVLLDVFGADISADESKRLEAFNDAVIRRGDPARIAMSDQDRKIADLEAKLADRDAKDKERAAQASDERGRGNVQRAMTEGFKDGDVEVIPAGAYPYCEHLTKIGQEDAFGAVLAAAREMTIDFQKVNDREPSRKEVGEFIKISAETLEKHYRERVLAAQLPRKNEPEQRAKDPTPRTITSDMGSGGTAATKDRPMTKDERHAAIRAKLLKETATAV